MARNGGSKQLLIGSVSEYSRQGQVPSAPTGSHRTGPRWGLWPVGYTIQRSGTRCQAGRWGRGPVDRRRGVAIAARASTGLRLYEDGIRLLCGEVEQFWPIRNMY